MATIGDGDGSTSSSRDLVSIPVSTDQLALSTPPPINLYASTVSLMS